MSCLNSQFQKISKSHIIYKKQTRFAIKTHITHKNLKDIHVLCMKTKQSNRSVLAAILDAILYQCSLITCSQIIRPYHILSLPLPGTTLNLMQ